MATAKASPVKQRPTRVNVEDRREQLVEAAIRVMSREGLERATTRRIAEEANAPLGVVHYAFRDKNEILSEVLGAITKQIEQVLRAAVKPDEGLASAIDTGLRAFWKFVTADDGLQLLQYELTIFSRRTPGYEWLSEWQYSRYRAVALEVFETAAANDSAPPAIPVSELVRVLIAGLDGLILQYEVSHNKRHSNRDLQHLIAAGVALAGARSAK